MQLYRQAFRAMGTACELQLAAPSAAQAQQAAQAIVADVARLERRYSRYRPDSFLSHINQIADQGGRLTVDPETAALLDYAQACHTQSAGLFDVTSGRLRQLWRFDRRCLPNPAAVEALMPSIGWDKLHWENPVLAFPLPGLELDLGGIVKEYAADRAARLAEDAGVRHGMVNLGGDIKLLGPHADGTPWRVGIRHPRQAGVLHTLALHTGAVASSGDYERCIIVEGVRYGHILNPRTGWPVQHLAAVTVVSELCIVAGSAATIALLKEQDGPAWLAQLGLPHLWVDAQGRSGGTLLGSLV